MELKEYLTEAGVSPFGAWFEELDPQAAARVTVALARMENGNLVNAKGVGAGVTVATLGRGARRAERRELFLEDVAFAGAGASSQTPSPNAAAMGTSSDVTSPPLSCDDR